MLNSVFFDAGFPLLLSYNHSELRIRQPEVGGVTRTPPTFRVSIHFRLSGITEMRWWCVCHNEETRTEPRDISIIDDAFTSTALELRQTGVYLMAP